MTFSLLFVDDHPLYREGLRRALLDAMPDLRVIDVPDGPSALAALAANAELDLCLVDYRLADADGLELLAEIGRLFPAVARGVLCSAPTGEVAARAKDAGCLACLSKDRSAASLVTALSSLRDGHAVFDVPPTPTTVRRLTERRVEILRHAAGGLTNQEIADRLGISERTVKDHWSYIFLQLDVTSRAEAVSRAHRAGLL
jgi:DNA-binding NarL/FixJ family response regulator